MAWIECLAASDSGLPEFLLGFVRYVGPFLGMFILWKSFSIKPTLRLIFMAYAWMVLGLIASVFPQLSVAWAVFAWICFVLLTIDFVALLSVRGLKVERVLPGRFALDIESEVELKLSNPCHFSLSIECYDGLPDSGVSDGLPWSGRLPSRGFVKLRYPLRFKRRGLIQVDSAHVCYSAFLKLWTRQVRVGESEETRVYPNYEPVVQRALLAMENQPDHMGIVMKNRAGMSKDFHQLREYQLGDTLSRVDWKATSRKLQLISRDYQEQRDQTLILAVDCGQRMRSLDGGTTQFDHCLNAMLLLAYEALKRGDNVGVMSFGGNDRYLAPVKGIESMTTILNHLYDYETTPSPSDYAEAAESFLVRQKRRSMVVFLTNVRGEDGKDLIEPLRMVRQKHVTILANLKEHDVLETMTGAIESLDDALAMGATQMYLDERDAVMRELAAHGIISVDATAQELPVVLANTYLQQRGRV